ncbi:ATP-dependent RNA helicase [Trametes elegans]|nr:ATP-dependent RNA helicase [Trametes elegans]
MQPTFASVPAVSSVFSEQTASIASSVARQFSPAPPPNVQAVRPSVASNTVEDTDEQYWNSFDDDGAPGVEVFDDPGPSAVLTPATPPATQPRALPPAVAPPSEIPLANPPVDDARELQKKPYYPEVKDALQRVFKLSSFRALQLEAICEAMDGRDLFVLFPTGSGKSLTFQLPAVCLDGVTVVVSPLKSLIQDQDRALRKLGVDVMVIMGDMPQQRTLVLQRLGDLKPPKLLYLTPEMLQQSDHMRGALKRLCRIGKLKRFVVDEAHLITDWGRTFRSAVRPLRQLRTEFPSVPISALTATANEEVQQDIIKRLDLKICKPLKLSFNRANLDYEVRPRKKNTVKEIADYVHQTHPGDTGIIYCSSRDRCKTLADTLRDQHSLNARDYHAGMPDEERQYIQTLWSTGKVQIIVATIAFGMGIDKPDVRFVIHFNLPSSLKGYYQETGRAGRDGKVAHCILYFTVSEFYSRLEWIRKDSVDKPEEERVWLERQFRDVLGYCMNDVHCRRLQVLNFFGEKFDPRNCRQMCNNCRDPIPITTEDHTQDAQQAIALFEGLAARSKRLTRNQFVSALKGSKTKEMGNKGLTSEALFGCCRHMQQNLVERLVDEMFYEEILSSEQVANGGGYSQAYLLVCLHFPLRSS